MSTFKNRQNKCFDTVCGQKIWKSRNVAVATCILRPKPQEDSKLQILAIERGPAVTDTGKFCFPCGYLDWDETVEQGALREVFEESNISLSEEDLEFQYVNSDPNSELQNVTMHFIAYALDGEEISGKNAEEGEITSVRWVDIENIKDYIWAFNHDKIALNYLRHVL